MPGPDRTSRSSLPPEPEAKIPRPPNAWILFRSDMVRSIDPNTTDASGRATRKTQAVVSKEVADLWRTASPAIRAEYERRADAKKAEHSIQYPNYRFAPLKKEDKQKLKDERKMLKEQERANKRRARAAPYMPSPIIAPSSISGTPAPSYPLAAPSPFPHPFAFEASPPYSAHGSPEDFISAGEMPLQTPTSSLLPPNAATDSSSSQENRLMLSVDPEQPIAGPSHWNDLNQASWHGDASQQLVDPGYVQFDIPQQHWMGSDMPMNAICSTTGDPSVYQLAFDQNFMGDAPLELSLSEPLDPSLFPDMRHLDFSSLLDGIDSNFDFFGDSNAADPVINPALLSSEYPTQHYNGEEYLNYEQAQSASSRSSSSTQLSTPAPPEQSTMSNPIVSTASYTPPTGAAFSSQRRVAGSWPRSFAVEGTNSPQPQPAQIPTPVNS